VARHRNRRQESTRGRRSASATLREFLAEIGFGTLVGWARAAQVHRQVLYQAPYDGKPLSEASARRLADAARVEPSVVRSVFARAHAEHRGLQP
jgi:hypothetical protein